MLSKKGKISLYAFFRYYILPEFNPWWFSLLHTTIMYILLGYLISLLSLPYAIPFIAVGILSGIGRFLINTQFYDSDTDTDTDTAESESSVKEAIFERERLTFPVLTLFFLVATIGILFGIYRFVFDMSRPLNVTLCSFYSVYWVFLIYLGRISVDKDKSKFFVHIYSSNKILWKGGSIAFENGDKQFDEENFYRSFYYFWVAEKRYRTLSESESREPYKTIARLQSEAAELSKEAILNPRESETYFEKANKIMEDVINRSKYRVCTHCGDTKKVEDCNIFITENNLIDQIICNSCYKRKDKKNNKKNNKTHSKTKEQSNDTQSEKQKRTRSNTKDDTEATNQRKQQDNKRTNKDQSKTPERQTMTLSEAFDLLKLDKDKSLTESEVKIAFKKQVFDYHPDHGGSREEFMRLKKARKKVTQYVNKS